MCMLGRSISCGQGVSVIFTQRRFEVHKAVYHSCTIAIFLYVVHKRDMDVNYLFNPHTGHDINRSNGATLLPVRADLDMEINNCSCNERLRTSLPEPRNTWQRPGRNNASYRAVAPLGLGKLRIARAQSTRITECTISR